MNGDDARPQITLDAAQEVTISAPTPDRMAADEATMFAHQENMQNAQLGWIGRFWGSKSEKPGNVSAIVAILLVAYLGVLIFWTPESKVFSDVFAGITSIITLILGYLFGSSDRR